MKKLLTVLLLSALLSAATAWGAPVLLKSRTIAGGDADLPWSALAELSGRHALVQLAQTPTAAQRDALAAQGVRLLAAIPQHAYLAYIEPRRYGANKALSPFRLVAPLEAEDKMQPRLVAGDIDEYAYVGAGEVLLVAKFFADVPVKERPELLRSAGAEIVTMADSIDLAYVTVAAPEDAWQLADLDGVQYVSIPEPAWEPRNNKVRALVRANAVHEPPYSVNGDGVPVLIFDGGIVPATTDGDAIHPDLKGRYTQGQTGMPDITGHANHVSCTVAGNGAMSDGTYAGMAPGASIVSMDITASALPGNFPFVQNNGDIDLSYKKAIEQYGVRTANNSIGANLGANQPITKCAWMGDYTMTSALIDELVGGKWSRPLIIVWAAGNEVTSGCPGTFYTIPPPSPAKNTISVGATSVLDEEIAFFSSRGPTDDGRLRPDIAAPGHEKDQGLTMIGTHSCATLFGTPMYMDMSGTSQASPVVTGATALALEYWDKEIGGDDPPPALMKGFIIHSAVDLGNPGPDYTYGYGGLRIPPLLDLIHAGTFDTVTVEQGDDFVAKFKKSGAGPVKVTIVWTDPPGAYQAKGNLVNDLDLVIIGPNGTQYDPWLLDPTAPAQPAGKGADHLNNTEQVYIANAPSGDYEVHIKGNDVAQGPQDVSYVYSGLVYSPDTDDDDNTPDDDDASPADDDDASPVDDDDDAADDDDDDDSGGCGC
ncbi:MAG: S8 family serine peptidase [Myxococcales bacterium]|nr:S8 family serine peptidase [Myxococcales bacterium]